jgi:hypothetical protein
VDAELIHHAIEKWVGVLRAAQPVVVIVKGGEVEIGTIAGSLEFAIHVKPHRAGEAAALVDDHYDVLARGFGEIGGAIDHH